VTVKQPIAIIAAAAATAALCLAPCAGARATPEAILLAPRPAGAQPPPPAGRSLVIRAEMERALASGDLATKAEVAAQRAQIGGLRARLEELKAQLARIKARIGGDPASQGSAPVPGTPPRRDGAPPPRHQAN
jgi:hypothetical protein